MNGSQEDKLKLAFKMIDCDSKGYFTKTDLSSMIRNIISSHFTITGTYITPEMEIKI